MESCIPALFPFLVTEICFLGDRDVLKPQNGPTDTLQTLKCLRKHSAHHLSSLKKGKASNNFLSFHFCITSPQLAHYHFYILPFFFVNSAALEPQVPAHKTNSGAYQSKIIAKRVILLKLSRKSKVNMTFLLPEKVVEG